jgi:tRNA (guanine-N7-)-methyltransferase
LSDPTTIRRLYGRSQAFKLRPRAQRLIDDLLPRVAVPDGPLDARRLFGDDRPLELEIGFGKGEHLAWHARTGPDTGFIGCEPFLNGVTGLLGHIEDADLKNVRIHMGDALGVLERLPDAALDRVYLLHPDPWPKARHAKRRFVNRGPLDLVAAKLKPGGELRIATDHPVYMRWTLLQMARRDDFDWLAENPADWEQRPADWPPTRYGEWAAGEGRPIWHFAYRRAAT